MKKIFTLIAMALMAIGVNAQEQFLVNAETNLGDYEGVDYKATPSVKLNCGENPSGWNAVSALNGDENHAFDIFTHYTSGKDNPVSGTSTKYSISNHALPTKGAYYIFKPSAAGSLQVGIILNGDKDFYVVDGDGNALSAYDMKGEDGSIVELSADSKASSKVYGVVTFNVEASKSYYVFCNGSKLGFAGFKFSTTAATIDPATTAAAKEKIDAANTNAQGGGNTDATEFIVTFNGSDDQTVAGYFDFGTADNKHNFNSKFTDGSWNGTTFASGLKMEGSTLVHWTSTEVATVTIVQSAWGDKGLFFDDVKYERASGTEDSGCIIYTIQGVAKGEHKIHRISGEGENQVNAGESGLFAVKVAYTPGVTPSGIQTVKSATIDVNAPAYNLAGQKVDKSFKGVVIQNGKKMIQK